MTTIETIFLDLLMAGADRGAVVRDDGTLGVIVLMLDKDAESTLGAALYPILADLGSEPVGAHDGRPPGKTLDWQTPITEIFEEGAKSPRHWLAFQLWCHTIEIFGLVFSGDICRQVAAICNQHRCPCSLDPRKAAPGWNIDRTIQKGPLR